MRLSRWFAIAAIVIGLFLMGSSAWLSWTGARNVLALPDAAGHEIQYVVMFLFAIATFVVGMCSLGLGLVDLGIGPKRLRSKEQGLRWLPSVKLLVHVVALVFLVVMTCLLSYGLLLQWSH